MSINAKFLSGKGQKLIFLLLIYSARILFCDQVPHENVLQFCLINWHPKYSPRAPKQPFLGPSGKSVKTRPCRRVNENIPLQSCGSELHRASAVSLQGLHTGHQWFWEKFSPGCHGQCIPPVFVPGRGGQMLETEGGISVFPSLIWTPLGFKSFPLLQDIQI